MSKENANKVIEALKLIKEMELIPLITLQALAEEILSQRTSWVKEETHGAMKVKYYLSNRGYHNLYGPAFINYNHNGEIINKYYYVMGIRYSEEDFMKYFGFLSKD